MTNEYDVVIVGAGAAGAAIAASLLRRRHSLRLAIVDPADRHYYQPGWTLVGRGVFRPESTVRPMEAVIPKGAEWVRAVATAFEPDRNTVLLGNGRKLTYRALVMAPGLKLDWDAIPGLVDALGRNGVTSNYRFDLAPYTWRLVQSLERGKAIFTQPPMPIKCAGAPQKAMYLSCDHWLRTGRLSAIDVSFCNAGGVLFGVSAYVPALMAYIERYGINLQLQSRLISIDGVRKEATFEVTQAGSPPQTLTRSFEMLHVCPPQVSPDIVRESPLADAAGWLEADPATLRHPRFANVFSAGDACATANAKTAAAARKQAPIVAENVLSTLDGKEPRALYDGYGSCPLTVERGRIVLAEFGYGGKLLPTFPKWLIDGSHPSRLAWLMKERILPPVYWHGMLKGREWLVRPKEFAHAE